MSSKFSQDPQSGHRRYSYHHDEPVTPLWKRALPVVLVLTIGAAIYYAGSAVGARMAGEIENLDLQKADTGLVQRTTIGDGPDLMVPQPTFAPQPQIVSVEPVVKQHVSRPSKVVARPKPTKKPYNVFEDDSIPYRPAEDYVPGVEPAIEDTPPTVTSDSPDLSAPLPNVQAPGDKPEKTYSPVPVPEPKKAARRAEPARATQLKPKSAVLPDEPIRQQS